MADFTVNVTGTIANDAVTNAKLANMAEARIKMRAAGAGTGDPIDGTANEATTLLKTATDPFVRVSELPAGGGDVVGPASSTNNNVPQWDGTTGKLLKDGLATSTGGNGAADSGKLPVFRAEGGLYVTGAGNVALNASTSTTGDAISASANSGDGAHLVSISGNGLHAINTGAEAAVLANAQGTGLAVHGVQNGGGGSIIARFDDGSGLGMDVETDGGLQWNSATGAATTRTNLGLGTAALNNTGDFATAAQGALADSALQDGDTLTSGLIFPNGGLRVRDTANNNNLRINPSVDMTGDRTLSLNVDADVSLQITGNVTLSGGTLSGTNTGDQTNIAGNAATVTTNANLTGPITSVGNATTIADAELAAIAGLTSAADKGIQFTGSGTAALIDLKQGVEAAYTGTPTWTAGAAPSSTANLRQYFMQVGNLVTFQISLTYATTGTTVTNLTLTLPTEFPTPDIPTGFTGASARLYPLIGRAISSPTGTPVALVPHIIRNAADNGFEIIHNAFTSGSYRTFIVSGSYFTA